MLIDPYIFDSSPTGPIALAYGFNSSDYAAVQAAYPALEKDVTVIETTLGVGTPGVLEIDINYVNQSVSIHETIFVDTTSAETFFTDILNWLYSENVYGMTFSAPLNQYLVDEAGTYLIILEV